MISDNQESVEKDLPPNPPLIVLPSKATHRSNPSTTSSGYLRAAEDLMTRIKARKVSDSSAAPDVSGGSVGGRIASGTSSEWDIAALAVKSLKAKGKGKAVESSRNIFRTAHSDAAENIAMDKARLESRRPTSAGSNSINPDGQINNEDLNRFVSATTAATATTVSTSFVKHAGPRGGAAGMRMIKPDDVLGIVPDKVGKMRYDKATMRWVREGLERVDEAGESRASRSRSDGSEDIFAGLDSWGEGNVSVAGGIVVPEVGFQEPVNQDDFSDSESSESEDGAIQLEEKMTQIIDADSESSSDTSLSDMEMDPLAPQIDPLSPHSPLVSSNGNKAAAAPITTPTPTTSAPQPIRSALRNSNVATPAALKKRAAWHDSVTPAAGVGSARRSVSFSDGKKAGRIAGLHSEDDINVGVFRRGDAEQTAPDATHKRIEAMLGGMNKISKPPSSSTL